MTSPGDITLASYEAAADLYRELSPSTASVQPFLDRVADLVGTGDILELGSGTGRDATYLESRGLRVIRTDATSAFVAMMRADGFEARVLDVRDGELGGPFDAVFANAVLLHLTREELCDVLRRATRAVTERGILAFTLKEGDGEDWSNARLEQPRHFTYWREPALRAVLVSSGWNVISLEHVAGGTDPWLQVIGRPGADDRPTPSKPAIRHSE